MSCAAVSTLCERARAAMVAAGFVVAPPAAVLQELTGALGAIEASGRSADIRDLRSLLWSSIDNKQSRDLDQIEYVEQTSDGMLRLMVGIADVDCVVRRDSQTDAYAAQNTTSVYTGVSTFPMLPDRLSTDLTSLRESTDRLAIVVRADLSPGGENRNVEVFQAWVRNQARLSYEEIGPWLEGKTPTPAKVSGTNGLEAQLRLQQTAAIQLQKLRRDKGALDLETIEPAPVTQNGEIVSLNVEPKNQARELIENFMIAANTAMAAYLRKAGVATIQRIVKTPERWPLIVDLARKAGDALPTNPDPKALSDFMARRRSTDPNGYPELSLAVVKLLGKGEYAVLAPGAEPVGHFGLAVHDYSHSTAPNRRYPDLIIQRLVKAAVGRTASYNTSTLATICAHCMERESAARKIERLMRKIMAAYFLKDRIGQTFAGVITGAKQQGVFVRVIAPPAEGRVVKGETGLTVGERVQVRLLAVDLDKGFIDFGREN